MPANMHRVRLMAWHLRELGWDFDILCPAMTFQRPEWIDPDASRFFAPEAPVIEAGSIPGRGFLDALGIRSASWQALLPMYQAGATALRRQKYDLVFISTTAFNFFCLGRLWRRQFGTPYILDFQDPWFRESRGLKTTKHVWKGRIGNRLSRYMEFFAVQKADGMVSVSPNYLEVLKSRYPTSVSFERGNFATIPFGARGDDFPPVTTSKKPGVPLTIGYVGVGSVVMEKSFRRLAMGLARLRRQQPDLVNRIRLQLFGTDGGWREGDLKILQHQADIAGIGDLVAEDPRIVPYSQATAIAAAADSLLVLGVDDPAYMASKLFSYAQLGKPLLACLHRASQMNGYFEKYPELGTVIHFGISEDEEKKEDALILDFLEQLATNEAVDRKTVLAEHSSLAMTRNIVELFAKCTSLGTPA
jgi:glycosyltransferase involved in cell wall biosynthesis